MKNKNKLKWFFRVSTYVCILLIFLVFFLFTHQFSRVPASLYIDEVAMLVDAKALVSTGRDMHGNHWLQALFPSYGDYKMPVYIWAVYIVSLLFSPSALAVRLPNLLAGLGTLVIVYGLVRTAYVSSGMSVKNMRISNLTAAVVSMLVLVSSPWMFQFSRTGFEAFFGQFLLSAAILVLVYSKKRLPLLLLSVLLAAAATYTYFSVRYVWLPVFATWVCLELDWSIKKNIFKMCRLHLPMLFKAGISVLLFVLLLVPLFRSPYYADSMRFRLSTPSVLQNHEQVVLSNVYREIAGDTLLDRVFFHRYILTGQSFAKNMSETLSLRFLFLEGDANLRHGTGKYGLFLLPNIAPFFAGLYVLAKKRRKFLAVLVVWIVAAAVPASVPVVVPHALRFINALVPFAVIITVGLYELMFWFRYQIKSKWQSVVFLVAVGSIFVFYSLAFFTFYFSVYPKVAAESWDQYKTELAVAISPYVQADSQIYIVGLPDKSYLWLLAYGPYTGKEFATWRSDQFQFTELGTVTFNMPDKYAPDQILVLPKSLFEEQTSIRNSIQLQKLQEIIVHTGETFVVVKTTDTALP